MDSHIQIPKCVFKKFVNSKQYFYKYNVKNNEITKGYPKSTYTEEDYYSKATEKALNLYVETPLYKLFNFVNELPKLSIPITVENDIKEIAWVYIKSLIARSPTLYNEVMENSVFLQFSTKQTQHDIIVDYTMKTHDNKLFSDKFDLSFIINETKTPLVLPTRGLYEYSTNGVICINSPLNPYCAILLKEKGKTLLKENIGENEIVLVQKNSDDIIMQLNNYAFQKQVQDGVGYVVSHDKKILEELKNEIFKNKL